MILIPVAITIVVVVAPGPILLLLLWREFAEVPMRVPVRLHRPILVIDDLVVVPVVVIGVIRIVGAIVMMFAATQSSH